MKNYVFFHRDGMSCEKLSDPYRPETWPYPVDEIKGVHLDCTDLFLSRLVRFPNRRDTEKFNELLDCIAKGYKEKLRVEFASERMGMSKSRFHTFFRSRTGMSFVAYANKVRIENSARLLIETDLTVENIGFDCGFDSPSHFYKCFKQHYGMSPAKFRVETTRS